MHLDPRTPNTGPGFLIFSKGTNMELQTAVVVTLTENGKTVKRTIKKSEQFDEKTSWDHIVKTTKSLADITLNSIA